MEQWSLPESPCSCRSCAFPVCCYKPGTARRGSSVPAPPRRRDCRSCLSRRRAGSRCRDRARPPRSSPSDWRSGDCEYCPMRPSDWSRHSCDKPPFPRARRRLPRQGQERQGTGWSLHCVVLSLSSPYSYLMCSLLLQAFLFHQDVSTIGIEPIRLLECRILLEWRPVDLLVRIVERHHLGHRVPHLLSQEYQVITR